MPDRGEQGLSGGPAPPAPASLLRNTSWLLVARAFELAASSALAIYAVRTLSVGDYGRYSIVIALVSIFVVVSDMGIASLTLREMSSGDRDRGGTIMGTSYAAELSTSILTAPLLFGTALALGYPGEVVALVALGWLVILAQGFAAPVEGAFNSRRLLAPVAGFAFLQAAVTAAAGFTLLSVGAGPAGLLLAIFLGHACAAITGFVRMRRTLRVEPIFAGVRGKVAPFLKASLPIALTGAVSIVYGRVDVLMLSKLDSTEAVAIYSVPYTVVQYTWLLPSIVSSAFFPLLAEQLRGDTGQARSSFFLLGRFFLLFSVPIAIVLAVAADDIIGFVFGADYEDSAGVLAIIAWTSVLGFQNYLLWYGILACYKERSVVAIMAAGLALKAALNAILIPEYGPEGAAITLLVADVTIVAGQAAIVHRHLFRLPLAQLFWKPLAAGVPAALLVLALSPLSEVAAAAAGASAYVVALLLLRYISRQEWRPITDPLQAMLRRPGTASP